MLFQLSAPSLSGEFLQPLRIEPVEVQPVYDVGHVVFTVRRAEQAQLVQQAHQQSGEVTVKVADGAGELLAAD